VGTIALFIGLSSSSRPAKTATTAAPATNTKPVATAPAAVPAPEPPQPEIAPAAGPSSAASPAPSTAATAPADTAPTAQAVAAEEPPARTKTARSANEDRPSTSRASSNDQAPKTTSSPAAASPKTSDGTAAPRRLKASEGGFDDEAAAEGLQAAVASAATCKSASSPEGVARVTVTFAPSGQVVSATVGAPFTGTLEAECISGKFRALHVPPFSGDPVVLRKSVRMQ
jgi:hypothetical protein